MSPEDAADASYLQALREHARWQQPCDCIEQDGLLLVTGPNERAMGFRNAVARLDTAVSPTTLLDRTRKCFGALGRGFTILVRHARDADIARHMVDQGLAPVVDAPCMLVQRPIDAPVLADGVRVERIARRDQVDDFLAVNEDAYSQLKLPRQEMHLYFGRPDELLSPRVVGFIAYRDGLPAAAALTILHAEGAGVYWVGTASHAQRAGLGEACTRLATNAGFHAGARVVTLQASPFGEPLYRKLGYRTYDRLLQFRMPPP
jgi:ribosomal protein S18 acetylase RimI-like enzyme